jgi:hypothetical protein
MKKRNPIALAIDRFIHNKLIKTAREGECLPPWYGVVYIEWYRQERVCLPVPLNLIARIVRAAWLFIMHGNEEVRLNPRDAYHQGRRDGLIDGFKECERIINRIDKLHE